MKKFLSVIVAASLMLTNLPTVLSTKAEGATMDTSIIQQQNGYLLENDVLSVQVSTLDNKITLSSVYGKEAAREYISQQLPLFTYKINNKLVKSTDDGWSLVKCETRDIITYDKQFGQRLDVTMKNEAVGISVISGFEIYNNYGGLRINMKVVNNTDTPVLISEADVISIGLKNENQKLMYTYGTQLWGTSNNGLDNAKMNCLSFYEGNDGWTFTIENNFSTSLADGGFTGDKDNPFFFLNAFNTKAQGVTMSTNPVALKLTVKAKETIEFGSASLTAFAGDEIDAKMSIEEHQRLQYKYINMDRVFALNDWEWFTGHDYDLTKDNRNDATIRNDIIPVINKMGFDELHIDDDWNFNRSLHASPDARLSLNPEAFFTTDLRGLSDYIYSKNVKMGLWYSISGGWWGAGKDMANPDNVTDAVKRMDYLVNEYNSSWQQVDLGHFYYKSTADEYSTPEDGVYRRTLGTAKAMNTVAEKYPNYMMQITPEVDNPAGQQGMGLMYMPTNGIFGLYDRSEYPQVSQQFASFGIIPFEGMFNMVYLNAFTADSGQLYSFLLGRHTSLYDLPKNFTEAQIETTKIFSDWRKNSRIKSLLNEVTRPVYYGESNDFNGPFSWMYTSEDKTDALLFCIGGPDKTTKDVNLNLRWLDSNKKYLIEDISLDNDNEFNYSFKGVYSGQELKTAGFDVNLDESKGRGKAFYLTEYNDNTTLAYADHYAQNTVTKNTADGLNVTVEGVPGDITKLFVYKKNGGIETREVRIGKNGTAVAKFDNTTVTEAQPVINVNNRTYSTITLEFKNISENAILQRADMSSNEWVDVAEITSNQYTDTNLVISQSYYYRLKNLNNTYTNSIVASTLGEDYWNVTLKDDFEDGYHDGWNIVSGEWSVISENSSNKVLKQSGTGDNWISKPVESSSDYIIEARMKIESGEMNAGISARMLGNGDRFQFDYSNQSIRMFRRNNTQALISKPTDVNPGEWNTISLKVDGEHIEGFINGTKILSMDDSELTSGGIGLYSWATQVLFDDVKIYTKTQATVELSENSERVTGLTPTLNGVSKIPSGTIISDSADNLSNVTAYSKGMISDGTFYPSIENEMYNWIEYQAAKGAVVRFTAWVGDKGFGISDFKLQESNDGIIWNDVRVTKSEIIKVIDEYYNVNDYVSVPLTKSKIRIVFPDSTASWKVRVDDVSAYAQAATIEILNKGLLIGSNSMNYDGSWSVNITTPLDAGVNNIQVVMKNEQGNIVARSYYKLLAGDISGLITSDQAFNLLKEELKTEIKDNVLTINYPVKAIKYLSDEYVSDIYLTSDKEYSLGTTFIAEGVLNGTLGRWSYTTTALTNQVSIYDILNTSYSSRKNLKEMWQSFEKIKVEVITENTLDIAVSVMAIDSLGVETIMGNLSSFSVNSSVTDDVLKGDINGDDAVNVKDLIRLKKYFAGIKVDCVESALDVNKDSVVDTSDLAELKKILLGYK